MSVQIFVRGKLLGIADFLVTPESGGDQAFIGRSAWIGLLTEVLPRALLAELGLARVLLGSSGGDQFLIVLPAELRDTAQQFLEAAASGITELSGGDVRLIWSITENLGDWSDIRRRLNDEIALKEGTPVSGAPFFSQPVGHAADDSYFTGLAEGIRTATAIGWNPETPAQVIAGEGKQTWPIDGGVESIFYARHHAPEREKRPVWGVLRGDIDNFLIRIRRVSTIEEYLQLSITYKQFFAGELTIRCSMPAFWQKVSIIYSGSGDFAVYGDWDALLPLAREIQRVFHRFAEENLKDLPGPEGKTITMAVALAQDAEATIASLYEEAGANLALAKSSDKDCIFALGRILEWKQLADAEVLKDDLTAMIRRYGASPEYIHELCGLYRETASTRTPSKRRGVDRPWRYYRRLGRMLPSPRSREGQKIRNDIVAGFVGRNPANAKLRPSGRVALEWARLATDTTGFHQESEPAETTSE